MMLAGVGALRAEGDLAINQGPGTHDPGQARGWEVGGGRGRIEGFTPVRAELGTGKADPSCACQLQTSSVDQRPRER